MTNIVDIELGRQLAMAGCGIVRRPQGGNTPPPEPVAANGTPPSLMRLLQAVSMRTGWSIIDMRSPRRFRDLVRARMIYYELARRVTGRSMPQIGRSLGGRDHSTVLHGLRRVARDRGEFEPELSELLAAFAPEDGEAR